MGKKRRGHGWTRRKGYSKKRVQVQNDAVVETAGFEASVSKKKVKLSDQQRSGPRRSAEEWRQYLLAKYNGHSTQCHFFGIRRGCMACYNGYRSSVGDGFFSRGEF